MVNHFGHFTKHFFYSLLDIISFVKSFFHRVFRLKFDFLRDDDFVGFPILILDKVFFIGNEVMFVKSSDNAAWTGAQIQRVGQLTDFVHVIFGAFPFFVAMILLQILQFLFQLFSVWYWQSLVFL